MGTLICRANIGKSRDQGVFSGKLCKNEIENLAIVGKTLLRLGVKELGFFVDVVESASCCCQVHPFQSICAYATVKFRNVLMCNSSTYGHSCLNFMFWREHTKVEILTD